jgi:hypothetical protein
MFANFRKATYVAEFVLFRLHVHPSIRNGRTQILLDKFLEILYLSNQLCDNSCHLLGIIYIGLWSFSGLK